MKKSLLLITMLLLSAAWVVAQSTSSTPSSGQTGATGSQSSTMGSQSGAYGTSGQSSQTSSDSGMKHESIKGCLSGSAGNYTLTDSATGKTYNLTGNTSDLSAHVGHEIEVKGAPENASAGATGSASTPSGSSASAGAAGAGQSSAAAAENFNVTRVKMISDTCSKK